MDAMLLRDRNHPAVILWSVGNEIPGRDNANGLRICKMLADYVRTKDTMRGVTSAVNDRTNIDAYFANLDVGGYNYNLNNAAADHRRVPSRVIVCTEFNGKRHVRLLAPHRPGAYIIGDFVWTALDYIGESGIGGWNDPGGARAFWHGSGCGDLDSTCYRKPISHYRNIVWNRTEKLYMAVRKADTGRGDMWAVRPAWESWTWPGMEGKDVTVNVFSCCDKVRLYLNDKLVGEKPTTQNEQFRASFTVPYEPGMLKATGVGAPAQRVGDKDVGEMVLRTAGDAAKIRLTPDRTKLSPTHRTFPTLPWKSATSSIASSPPQTTSSSSASAVPARSRAWTTATCATRSPTKATVARSGTAAGSSSFALRVPRATSRLQPARRAWPPRRYPFKRRQARQRPFFHEDRRRA